MAHNETRRAEKGTSSRELRKSMLETHLKHDRNRVLRRLESYENEIITKEIRYLFTLTGRSEDQHKLYTKCVEPKPEFNLIPRHEKRRGRADTVRGSVDGLRKYQA